MVSGLPTHPVMPRPRLTAPFLSLLLVPSSFAAEPRGSGGTSIEPAGDREHRVLLGPQEAARPAIPVSSNAPFSPGRTGFP